MRLKHLSHMQDHNTDNAIYVSLRSILAMLGPGLFLIGYNIGTGSVTTMASSGSRWGMQLTWIVLLSCVFVFFGIALVRPLHAGHRRDDPLCR